MPNCNGLIPKQTKNIPQQNSSEIMSQKLPLATVADLLKCQTSPDVTRVLAKYCFCHSINLVYPLVGLGSTSSHWRLIWIRSFSELSLSIFSIGTCRLCLADLIAVLQLHLFLAFNDSFFKDNTGCSAEQYRLSGEHQDEMNCWCTNQHSLMNDKWYVSEAQCIASMNIHLIDKLIQLIS